MIDTVLLLAVLAGGFGVVCWLMLSRRKTPDVDKEKPPTTSSNEWAAFRLVAPKSKRLRWMKGESSGSSSKSYSEIAKGPDRPARSRPAGKVGLVNQSNRLFSDWKTDHIQNRSAGRKDAHKAKSRPARKPKPK